MEPQSSTSRTLRPPRAARERAAGLRHRREERVEQLRQLDQQFKSLNAYLDIADEVSSALQSLSDQLFQQLLTVVEEKLTLALQEIIEQPLVFQASPAFKSNSSVVEFSILRNGHEEDILKGQGGSVANVLSVGLRMFALTTLDEAQHRRFLVLDEQDCWLRPDLVGKLVKIVHDAGRALGFQTIMISHHDISHFERYADRIYQFSLDANGAVQAREVRAAPEEPDDPA